MMTYKRVFLIITALVLAVGALAGCGDAVQTIEDATDATEAGVNVRVSKAAVRDIESTANYTGELIAEDMAYVTSKVSAKVEKINADLGDWVNKGDVLVYLDDTDYVMQLESAKAAYKQAEAAYNSALAASENIEGVNAQTEAQLSQAVKASEIGYNDAKANFDRQSELYQKGAISLVAYESAKSALSSAEIAYSSAKKNYDIAVNVLAQGNKKSAESSVATASAAISSAKLAVEQGEKMVANTVVRAPISGYISSKNVEIGQFVSTGMALFTIADTKNLEVEIKVTEAVVPYIEKGGKAFVKVPSANKEAEGEVSLVNPVKDMQSGMYVVRIAVSNSDDKFKVGMFSDVEIITSESEDEALCILNEAVIRSEEGSYVYVVKDNIAEKRLVTLSVTDGEYVSVLDGVEEGDLVVCEGKEYISEENNFVNIVE